MLALFVVLNETDYLEDILSGFVEAGVKGATILDSQGMASAILQSSDRKIPFFNVLESLMESTRPFNKTIFTVLEDNEILEKAVESVRDVMRDSTKPGAGFMFTVPIGSVYPLGRANQ